MATDCEVHFICVGTPQKTDSFAADLKYVESAIEMIGPVAKPNSSAPKSAAITTSRPVFICPSA
ncbi:MAG: hypothetical protein EBV84_06530 [Betaproteobacteria bacterium]|nr:hypothetical protein [Betaproteobacteria bacterium]